MSVLNGATAISRSRNLMLHESFVPVAREELQYRELDDGGVIYDTSAERIHTLNVTAAYIWNSCDGSHTLLQIATELHAHAKIPLDKAMNDIRKTIMQFEEEGLLRTQ
jgi:Coenzyme PQQ synthesis protein D (PqqD)